MKSRPMPTTSPWELAARLAGEEENRCQGMPSDGDSRAGYRAMGEAGWIGLHWPQEFGGRGLDPLLTAAAEERFGYHWLPLSSYLLSVKTIGNAMLDHAAVRAAGAAAARNRRRAARVLPGLLGAGGRLGPRGAAHGRRAATATATS